MTAKSADNSQNFIESPREIRPGKTRNLEDHIIRFSCALRMSENCESEIKLRVNSSWGALPWVAS